jgi:hypothetical protein
MKEEGVVRGFDSDFNIDRICSLDDDSIYDIDNRGLIRTKITCELGINSSLPSLKTLEGTTMRGSSELLRRRELTDMRSLVEAIRYI